MARVVEGGAEIRRHLADPECLDDFPMLKGLRQEGVTDYLIMPLDFTNGEIHAGSWSTRQPGGFSDPQLAALRRVRP